MDADRHRSPPKPVGRVQDVRRYAKGFLVIYGSSMAVAVASVRGDLQHDHGTRQDGDFYQHARPDSLSQALFNKRNRRGRGRNLRPSLNVYQTVETLILDDIGAGRMTEFDDSLLTEIVDYRYRNRMATVFVQ